MYSKFLLLLIIPFACAGLSDYAYKTSNEKAISDSQPFVQKGRTLIYYNEAAMQEVRKRISDGDDYYTEALAEVCTVADKYLATEADPVVNKSIMPPSGDKHDYLSIAPYWWPDPETKDGLPWIRRDGEVNPLTRGDDTDRNRLAKTLNAVTYLTFAYYFTQEEKYATKAIDLMEIWFADPGTRVNPNVNYGQGVPGRTDGRPFGIIEWTGIANVVTALQVFKERGIVQEETSIKIDDWLTSFVDWLLNSELGRQEGTRSNNHANWYDYQVVGILIYLGRNEEAKERLEAAKTNRIAQQIAPDGSQPEELDRTKSLTYSTMNLRAMSLVGFMAASMGVDLLHFRTDDGKSLLRAAGFLEPFATGRQDWPYRQISEGGWPAAVENRVKPLFGIMSSIYQKRLLPESVNMEDTLSPLQRLQYPPLLYQQN